MSDERATDGAAGDGDDDTTSSGTTAVVTRPLRPTGKRSRQSTADEDEDAAEAETAEVKTKPALTKDGGKAKAKTAKKSSGPGKGGRNPIAFVWTFLKQVVAELRKVIWPNRKQMVSYTSVVLVFLAFMVALIGVVDLGLAKLMLWLLSN